jgi:hypothetical protein
MTETSTILSAVEDTYTYSYTFDVLAADFVKVSIAGSILTNPDGYSVNLGASTITLVDNPLTGQELVIYRETAATEEGQLFQPASGAGLTEQNLTLFRSQIMHVSQEAAPNGAFAAHVEDTSAHLPSGGTEGQVLSKTVSGGTQWIGGLEVDVPANPDGALITWDSLHEPTTVAQGTDGQFLQISESLGQYTLGWADVSAAPKEWVRLTNGASPYTLLDPTAGLADKIPISVASASATGGWAVAANVLTYTGSTKTFRISFEATVQCFDTGVTTQFRAFPYYNGAIQSTAGISVSLQHESTSSFTNASTEFILEVSSGDTVDFRGYQQAIPTGDDFKIVSNGFRVIFQELDA